MQNFYKNSRGKKAVLMDARGFGYRKREYYLYYLPLKGNGAAETFKTRPQAETWLYNKGFKPYSPTKKPKKRRVLKGREAKTEMVIALRSNYGYGWEDECYYDPKDRAAARADLKEYNKAGGSHYLKLKRVKK